MNVGWAATLAWPVDAGADVRGRPYNGSAIA
jgi:hypothetical protein